jgi:quercetin dioxygenase-like cupin family protein
MTGRLFAFVFVLLAPLAAAEDPATMTATKADQIQWQAYAPMPGIKIATISGNPREVGPYTIRVWFSPGTMSRPHWHPETRYVTVLKGTWWAGTGEKFDPDRTTPMPAGSFVVHHPNKVHYDGAKDEEVIVQISGIGPSGTNFANPADDPKNRKP